MCISSRVKRPLAHGRGLIQTAERKTAKVIYWAFLLQNDLLSFSASFLLPPSRKTQPCQGLQSLAASLKLQRNKNPSNITLKCSTFCWNPWRKAAFAGVMWSISWLFNEWFMIKHKVPKRRYLARTKPGQGGRYKDSNQNYFPFVFLVSN